MAVRKTEKKKKKRKRRKQEGWSGTTDLLSPLLPPPPRPLLLRGRPGRRRKENAQPRLAIPIWEKIVMPLFYTRCEVNAVKASFFPLLEVPCCFLPPLQKRRLPHRVAPPRLRRHPFPFPSPLWTSQPLLRVWKYLCPLRILPPPLPPPRR